MAAEVPITVTARASTQLYDAHLRLPDGRDVHLVFSGVPANMVTNGHTGRRVFLDPNRIFRFNPAVIPNCISVHGGPFYGCSMVFRGGAVTGNGTVSERASLAIYARSLAALSERGYNVRPTNFNISNITCTVRLVNDRSLELSLKELYAKHITSTTYVPECIHMARLHLNSPGTAGIRNGVCCNILPNGKSVIIGVPRERLVVIVCEVIELVLRSCLRHNGPDFVAGLAGDGPGDRAVAVEDLPPESLLAKRRRSVDDDEDDDRPAQQTHGLDEDGWVSE